jgi:hypothetical protein
MQVDAATHVDVLCSARSLYTSKGSQVSKASVRPRDADSPLLQSGGPAAVPSLTAPLFFLLL